MFPFQRFAYFPTHNRAVVPYNPPHMTRPDRFSFLTLELRQPHHAACRVGQDLYCSVDMGNGFSISGRFDSNGCHPFIALPIKEGTIVGIYGGSGVSFSERLINHGYHNSLLKVGHEGIELGVNTPWDNFLSGFLFTLGKQASFDSVFKKKNISIGTRLLMRKDPAQSAHSVYVDYDNPVLSHIVWVTFHPAVPMIASMQYAGSFRAKNARLRYALLCAPGIIPSCFLSVKTRIRSPLPWFEKTKLQLYGSLGMEPGPPVLHAAVDLEGPGKRLLFAAVTNTIMEIGARFATWGDIVVKSSLLFWEGKIGLKFALSTPDFPERKGLA
jgi:hypothetical protein